MVCKPAQIFFRGRALIRTAVFATPQGRGFLLTGTASARAQPQAAPYDDCMARSLAPEEFQCPKLM